MCPYDQFFVEILLYQVCDLFEIQRALDGFQAFLAGYAQLILNSFSAHNRDFGHDANLLLLIQCSCHLCRQYGISSEIASGFLFAR